MRRLLLFLLISIWTTETFAKWSSRGQLGIEGRSFLDDNNENTIDRGLGLFGRLQVDHRSKPFRERLRLYGRLDREDLERTILVLEEAWAEWKAKPFRVRVGFDLLNWTATEAFHPADILNSRNLDSSIQNYDKLGEPMVSLSYKGAIGVLTAYFLPTVINPILPSANSRLSFSPGLRTQFAYLDHNGKLMDGWFKPQAALRWNRGFDDFDVSFHAIRHLDRSQPNIGVLDGAPTALFQTVTQVGGTYQHVLGAWILKCEGGWRFFESIADQSGLALLSEGTGKPNHGRLALGLEYGTSLASGAESTLILEGQTILGTTRAEALELDLFQGDVLLGYRYAFNDVDSKVLLVSVIVDVEDPAELIGSAQYSQRLGDTWTLNASLRVVEAPEPTEALGGSQLRRIRDSDFLGIEFMRHF